MRPIIGEKIREFFSEGVPEAFERDLSLGSIQPPARGNLVNVVVGVRRCGKTYRLYQEMRRIVSAGYPEASLLYFNFEDERLKPYDASLLSEVVETFYALNPRAREEGAFFFFDEVQEVPDWGLFLRRMVDTAKATIYVTGSSSKMLSLDIASEFRGRALPHELFPLSFAEYVRFHGGDIPPREALAAGALTAGERALLRSACSDYLVRGGFVPVQDRGLSECALLLQEYANRTVSYDVVERYGLANLSAASSFLAQCMASSARELSVNKVHGRFRSLGSSVSRETLSRLLGYYEESYLLFSVREFSRALADNPRSPAKVYAVDPGMLMAFSPSAARDEEQRLETAVYLALRRQADLVRRGSVSRVLLDRGSTRREVDFVVGDALMQDAFRLVQSSTSLADPATRKRELAALEAAMSAYGVEESWVVTLDEQETVQTDQGVVRIVPAWSWLLDGGER
ncbi:ATP-binding protein [Rubneribacter sp.]